MISDSRPKCLVIPESYSHPPPGGHAYPAASDICIDVNIPTYKYNKLDIIKLPVERTFENISIDQVSFFKKIFYKRSTNSAAFCVLQWMSLPHPFPSMQLKYITLFLLQGSGPITINGWDFSQSCNSYSLYSLMFL